MKKIINELPEFIKQHPNAKIPVEGVSSHLIQADNQQLIFMEFEQDTVVPTHFHNAQWGIVLDGEMELTINEITRTLRKGDSYSIKKDELHSAKIRKGYKDMTIFDQIDRYEKSE